MLADHVVWPSSASEDSAAPTTALKSDGGPRSHGRLVVRHRQQARPPGGRQRAVPGGARDLAALRLQGHRRRDQVVRRAPASRSPRTPTTAPSAVLDVFKEKLVKRQQSLKILDASEPRQSGRESKISVAPQGGHQLRGRQEDRQADPRRGPQGRQGAGAGRRAPRQQQEARRPPGGAAAGARARTTSSRCSSPTTADGATPPRRSTIEAPIEQVWAVMLDTASYGEWNPFVEQADCAADDGR